MSSRAFWNMTDFYQLAPGEQAVRLKAMGETALKHWDIDGADLDLIKMRENAVFRVDTRDGRRYALRIHRHGYHDDNGLRSEARWMKALDDAGIDVPQAVPSANGGLFERIEADGVPESRQVDLFEWIEGRQLGETGEGMTGGMEELVQAFRTVGELCARVHNQSADWTLPAGFTRHAWDEQGLTGEQPLWGRFWELAKMSDAERRLLEQARARVHQDLIAFGKASRDYSLIHADLTPENVLVDGERVRLIDFDDAGFGWHLFEIATALYFHTTENYYEAVRDALIAGYRSQRELPDQTLDKLPLFMLARSFTYLGWVHTREETETARELTPMLVEMSCGLAREYLD